MLFVKANDRNEKGGAMMYEGKKTKIGLRECFYGA